MNPREEIYLCPVLATSASANAFEDEIVSRGEQVVSCNRQILQNSSQLLQSLDLWKMILSDHDPIREVKFFQNKSHFTIGLWLRTVGGEVSSETINCRQVFQRKKPLIKEERLNLFRISAPVWIFCQENKSSNQVLYLSHYDDKLGKRLMFRMHFIMSQLVQRSKHKGSNFATLQHKFQTDADVFQGRHCQDVGC